MKNFIKGLLMLFVTCAVILAGCEFGGGGSPSPNDPVYDLVLSKTEIEVTESSALTYDYKSLFTATKNGVKCEITDDMIASTVKDEAGEYMYVVVFNNLTKTLKVIVTAEQGSEDPVYDLVLSTDEISVGESSALTYDYNSLFTATKNGVKCDITEDMVFSTVKGELGEYTYEVVFHEITKTLKVKIVPDHVIEAVPAYSVYELTLNELAELDYTTLFSLYVDGAPVKVTNEMLTIPDVTGAVVGSEYEVTLNYSLGKVTAEKTAKIKIVEQSGIVVTAKNIVTYPNGGNIDLTALFEITDGGKEVEVTPDMITGNINYSQAGMNVITLKYRGQTYTAQVEVTIGAIINYAKSDVVVIRKGTDKATYSFGGDFVVIINGVRFTGYDESYFEGLTELNFNEVGDYEVTLKIPYNSKPLPLGGTPNFDYTTKTITYKVVANDYEMSVERELVTLNKGTDSYDVTSNVNLKVNGWIQKLTLNKEAVGPSATYYEIVNGVDFDFKGNQRVVLDVYVYGVDEDPVRISYDLIIKSNVQIVARDTVIFSGGNVYPLDLFTLTVDGKEVAPTFDMLSGRIDVFTAGKYSVTLTYEGLSETAEVLVIESDIVGAYKTALYTIGKDADEDEEGYIIEGTKPAPIGDMIINADGTMTINEKPAYMLKGIDANTLLIKYLGNEYKLYYMDGIVALDPDNSIKLAFNNAKRPLLYVKDDLWAIEDSFTVNSTSTYVLNNTITAYSIDLFKLKSKTDDRSLWYGLKVRLTEKTSTDTVYDVEWGEATLCDGFQKIKGEEASLTFNDAEYTFIMTTRYVAKTYKPTDDKIFANMTFNGTVDGKTATLSFGSYENFTLRVDGKTVLEMGAYELGNLKYGGIDHTAKTVTVYQVKQKNAYDVSVLSYKFILNVNTKTFTTVEKDGAMGQYETDGKYVFLDGYGKGIVNYDTDLYVRTPITYQKNNNEITIKYVDTTPSFKYGESATFYIDDFMNVLTVKSFTGEDLTGVTFINNEIVRGAIVKMNRFKFYQGADSERRAELLNATDIITKDGTLTYDQKEQWRKDKIINFSKIKFGTAGFYQFSIDLTVDGEKITSYYAIQIISLSHQGDKFAKDYGNGVLNGYSFSLNEYGVATLVAAGETFTGYYNVVSENKFVAKMYDKNNRYECIEGVVAQDGIIKAQATGAIRFSDYYTTGSVKTIGCKEEISQIVLRKITVNDADYYVYATSLTDLGEFVTVELVSGESIDKNGAIVKITKSDAVVYAKLAAWGDVKTGIVFADSVMGEYTYADGTDKLILDGFGNATLRDMSGTYTVDGNKVTFATTDKAYSITLDKTSMTFTVIQLTIDNGLVEGRTFTLKHIITAEENGEQTGAYSATTTICFKANGKVSITSSSEEYVEDYGSYNSVLSGEGTFSVNMFEITININGYTIVLRANGLNSPSMLTVISTTAPADSVGYFGANDKFGIE